MTRAPVLSPRDAITTATQLVNHGLPEASEMIARLRRQLSNIAVQEYLDQIENRFRAIAALRHRDGIMADRQLMHRLYHPDEPVFVRNPSGNASLMLALATKFNNFQVSNAVFAAVLLELGYSVLILKDCTDFGYLKGVAGLGTDPEALAKWVEGFMARQGFDQLHIAGFSSSGFAALLISALPPCEGCICFSPLTDLGPGSGLPQPGYLTQALRQQIDGRFLCNLATRFETERQITPRTIVFGDQSAADGRHARNLKDLPGIRLVEVENCGHQTPGTLLERGQLLDVLRQVGAPLAM
jgi:pimeloyl-ACP methyl ester carboxylesterase